MHSSIIVLSAFMSSVMGQSLLGGVCSSSSQCPTGVSCYASNSMLQTLCGNTGANCASSLDCAFNTCISGSCEGLLSSSSAPVPVSTSLTPTTATSTFASSTATATALAVGAVCTATAQCASGAQCYASSSMAVAHCGNFGATCSSNSQCAYNTCISGSCSGTLSSSSSLISSYGSTLTSSASLKPTSSASSGAGNGGQNVTVTSTRAPAGFTTSVTVVNGVTSSVLVNTAGVTTSFGAVQTVVSVTAKGSGAGSLVAGMGGMLAVAGGVAMLL